MKKAIQSLRHFLAVQRRVWIGKRNPRKLASINYLGAMKKEMNWESPQDLNEKIMWLKFNSDTTEWTRLADKYRVREYIKGKGYEDILVPLIGCWEKVDDIDFEQLPEKYVLKTNNGAGSVIIVKDKTKEDIPLFKRLLQKWMNEDFGLLHAEPHYSAIKPLIIAEKLLEDTGDLPSASLVDYKMWCLNGKLFGTWATYDRKGFIAKTEWHDLEWNYRPEWSVFTEHYQDGGGIIPRPKNYERMVKIAEDLSAGFPQVRVDLYNINGQIYFGELTFSSAGGCNNFFTQEVLDIMGSLIPLPEKQVHQ